MRSPSCPASPGSPGSWSSPRCSAGACWATPTRRPTPCPTSCSSWSRRGRCRPCWCRRWWRSSTATAGRRPSGWPAPCSAAWPRLLAAVAAMAAVAAPWIMRAFTAGTDQAARDAKVRAGHAVPLVLPAPGRSSTPSAWSPRAVLNAEHRFNVPAVAPAVNNVVVLATYAAFWAMRDGAAPALDLTTAEKWVLAGGTTLGVVAFTAAAGGRRGARRLPPAPPARLARPHGAHASAGEGRGPAASWRWPRCSSSVVLVLANGVAGGVVTWTFAFAFFLLPFALFAVPVATTMFPGLARLHQAGRAGRVRRRRSAGACGPRWCCCSAPRPPSSRWPGRSCASPRSATPPTAVWRRWPTPSPPSPPAWSATGSSTS